MFVTRKTNGNLCLQEEPDEHGQGKWKTNGNPQSKSEIYHLFIDNSNLI
jgi:hypothetical protein